MNFEEKKIEKLKEDFILALKDISKSIELNSQKTKSGHFKLLSKEEEKYIKKLRGRMKKAHEISAKLKAIDRFKELDYLLKDEDPILVTYYCKFNYPNYAEIFVPILSNIYKEIQPGPLKFEVSMALDEFESVLLKKEVERFNKGISD